MAFCWIKVYENNPRTIVYPTVVHNIQLDMCERDVDNFKDRTIRGYSTYYFPYKSF